MGTSRSGLYLSTKGSRTSISDYALVHSNEGTFMNVGKNKQKNSEFRMKSGGHGQANIELLKKYGIRYNIVKTFPNGVRIGNIYNHKLKFKAKNNGQAWFPKSWSAKEIKRAGNHVASLKSNKKAKSGEHMTGMWKGVKVTVIKGNKHIPDTVCPSYDQPTKKRRRQK